MSMKIIRILCLIILMLIMIHFYVGKEEIARVWGKDGGWIIFSACNVDSVDDEKLTPFLATSLICEKQQKQGIVVEIPELVS